MSDTKKRHFEFPGNADRCGPWERIGTANGNRNFFLASRDDSRDFAIAAATSFGKATGRAAAGTDWAKKEKVSERTQSHRSNSL